MDNNIKEGRQVSALIHFADEVEKERAMRWIEKLKEQGHVKSYYCEEYNPYYGEPVWYIP